ncbi:MAG: helix-turn-helix transcriptional regulator [Clostridia bacterium]|nr:helix-turn-helix transcriptional regulator [Clostridia bacterium]
MYGKEIKQIRKSLNFTQTQVAQATGIPQNTLSWIEADKGIPNIQQCVLLANFYGVTLEELLGLELNK